MENNIIYPEKYNILGKRNADISTFGAGETSGKYARLASSITKLSMNRYRLTVDIWGSSSAVFNNYGVKVYGIVGNTFHLGTFAMDGTTSATYTYDFTVTKNVSVYARCVCSHCENNPGDDHYSNFTNQTAADTAYYENPNVAPTTPSIECTNTVITNGNIYIERQVNIRAYGSTDANGDSFFYQIYGQYYSNGSWVNMTGTSVTGQIDTTSSGLLTVDVSAYARGTRFKFWATASDSKATSGASSQITNIYRNSKPSIPTKITIQNGITVNGKIYVKDNKINALASGSTDPEERSLRYNFYGTYKQPGESFECSLGTSNFYIDTVNPLNLDIRPFPAGTKFTIWAKALDNFDVESDSSKVVEIYKNSPPTIPTLSVSAVTHNNKYYIINECNLTCSGSTDAEGDSITYVFYGSYRTTPTGTWISLGNSDNEIGRSSSSFNVNTTNVPRGSQLQLWAKALDSAGNYSDTSNTLDNVYKNRLPGNITSITTNAVGNIFKDQQISLNWNVVTDPDSHPVTYMVKIITKQPNQSVFVTGNYTSNTNSYEMDISNYPPATKFTFEITAKDLLNEQGLGLVSDPFLKDFPPEIILPKQPSTIYQRNPRLIFKAVEYSNMSYKIIVDCNGTLYNSVLNQNMFSTGELIDNNLNRVYVFRSINLNQSNRIKFKVILDGIFTSSETELVLVCEDLSVNLDNNIKTSIYSRLIDVNNTLRESYKVPPFNITKPVSGDKIQKPPILSLRESLSNIENKLNIYDPMGIQVIWETLGPNILKKDINSIVSKCKNL